MIDEMREMFSWLASTDRDYLVVMASIAMLAGVMWLVWFIVHIAECLYAIVLGIVGGLSAAGACAIYKKKSQKD